MLKKILLKGKLLILFGLAVTQVDMNYANSLDGTKLNSIRSLLIQDRESKIEELKLVIEKIESNPVPYLMHISDESNLRVYVKSRAVALLAFYQDVSIAPYLEGKIDDAKTHESIRKISVKSYTQSTYKKSPERVEDFLANRSNDKVLRSSIENNLNKARKEFNKKGKINKLKPNQSDQQNFKKK
jgi:hypothetical protein